MSGRFDFQNLAYLHKAWIGYVQPQGLVVTAAVLAEAEIFLPLDLLEIQARLVEAAPSKKQLPSFRDFAERLLGWSDDLAVWDAAVPPGLTISPDGQALSPSFAVLDPDTGAPLVLGLSVDPSRDLDARDPKAQGAGLSPHQSLERLLWETGIPVGVVENRRAVRLVFAPKGESVGFATFLVDDMFGTAGRDILGALVMLLSGQRIALGEPDKRLLALLQRSREYQNTVSTALREQVLLALGELLRGFQEADARVGHTLLTTDLRHHHLADLYAGLVTVIMRLVFLFYAEERGLLPLHDPLYAQGYSLTGLFTRLEADRARHGDAMAQRFGAWARLVSLFRLVYSGVHASSGLSLPARHGDLFDPDRYPFLEGREHPRQDGEVLELPKVSDAVVLAVLSHLALHNTERLMYRGLDVEHIGGVYEGLMGFDIELTTGKSACLSAQHVVVDLEKLARAPGPDRLRLLKTEAGVDLKDKPAAEVRAATDADALATALSGRLSPRQPHIVPAGTLVLQPGQERRKTGSHYTPRALTRPIVESTLRPIWERLGPDPTPAQILDLKVCDPAMGSGAFLVEVCRQLAQKLTAAWRRPGPMPRIPADEDDLLHARRLVAQSCLYGVDRNPLAVDLARVSLWLETFAAEHPFTFVDHALRAGDSLVGFSREQIASFSFHAETKAQAAVRSAVEPVVKKAEKKRKQAVSAQASQTILVRQMIDERVKLAEQKRRDIQKTGDVADDRPLADLWQEAERALVPVRAVGDLLVSAFFGASTDKDRAKARDDWAFKVQAWLSPERQYATEIVDAVEGLREAGEHPVTPFHWEVELPEVFARENPGFDAIVGNPPFAGKNTLAAGNAPAYLDWLPLLHEGSHGNADLGAHFFRRSFGLLREGGAFGLIATNTISQGDTRGTGLRWICKHGGAIYEARRRLKWAGLAKVVVSVVHVVRGSVGAAVLDGKAVSQITAFLFHQGGHDDPATLQQNVGLSFIGSYVLGMGFTFDDTSEDATPLQEMRRLIRENPRNQDIIFPYLGGEELNAHPMQANQRYVVNFGQRSEEEARSWPALIDIIERRVKGKRGKHSTAPWWQFERPRGELYTALREISRTLVIARVSDTFAFTFVNARQVLNEKIVVIAVDQMIMFTLLQSGVHIAWGRFTNSSLKDDMQYTPTDCFETFPFPPPGNPRTLHEAHPALEPIGQRYYDFRAALMVRNNEGLTKTYNRFHDPRKTPANDPDIATLRALHAEMDRAVLDAYGWTDILPTYDFRPQLDESTRYTWDDPTRDEVLGRLLELNRTYAAQQPSSPAPPTRRPRTPAAEPQPVADSPSPTPARPSSRPPKNGTPDGQTKLFD